MISTEGSSHGGSSIAVEREVAHFLATGESDPVGSVFPGSSIIERLTNHERCLREALLQEVQRRESGHRQHQMPDGFDPVGWTRRKVQPMIAGLFPKVEQEVVLGVAERSAVERQPGKIGGAWAFKGTRVPVRALFDNLQGGARVEDFLEWFPGVTRDQVDAVFRFTERSLDAVAA